MNPMPHEDIADLIKTLSAAQQMADRLELSFLSNLLAAGLLEAAMHGEGGRAALGDPRTRLDRLLAMKLRLCLGQSQNNVVMFRPHDDR